MARTPFIKLLFFSQEVTEKGGNLNSIEQLIIGSLFILRGTYNLLQKIAFATQQSRSLHGVPFD